MSLILCCKSNIVHFFNQNHFLKRYGFFLLLLSACIFVSPAGLASETVKGQIEKGDIDKRNYHYFELDNELKVLLVNDASLDKAAAALSVNVGSYSDPLDRQGLAHFLEHMLFLGTKKYPDPAEYQAYINDKGGSHNAFTGPQNTTYFFDVENQFLDPALDRFSEFFISPLFDPEYVDRERNAVHSEYQSKLQDDFRRSLDVYRNVVNPMHPAAKFSVGNLTTLENEPSNPLRNDLIDFYRQHYSANKMALVLMGNYSIDQLKRMVVQRFSRIKNNNKAQPKELDSVDLFLPKQLPIEVTSEPSKELRQMTMSFQLPSTKAYYKEKPLQFVASLLGYEGSGSLLSLLRRVGLAEGLTVGASDNDDGTGSFYISFQLTKKGVEERRLIRKLTFYAIETIKQKGIKAWRYEEKQSLADIAFQFRENAQPINAVLRLVDSLQHYPVEDIISGDYLLKRFDKKLIKRFFRYLKPDNLYVSSIFPDLKTDRVTQFYQVPYKVSSIKSEKLSKTQQKAFDEIAHQITLPEANPFIPSTVALFSQDEVLLKPRRFFEGEPDIWVQQDLQFEVPRVKVRLSIKSPLIASGVKDNVLASLYSALLQDQLNEFNYPGLLAGAGVFMRSSSRGIDITARGYYDVLPKLSRKLVDTINKPIFDPLRFDQIKSDLIRSWRNNKKRVPYRQLYNQVVSDLYSPYWSDDEKISALDSIDLSDLVTFAKSWRRGAKAEGLFYGNISQDWLKQWGDIIAQLTEAGDQSIQPIQVKKIQSAIAQYQIREVNHNDQAVVLYVQGYDDSLLSHAKTMVIRQILQSPFYSSLRTEQQLGYIVFLSGLPLYDVPGSVFIVQSPDASIDEIQVAITEFIADFEKRLPTDITVYKQAVTTKLLEKQSNLSAQADSVWAELSRGYPDLDRKQTLASLVDQLSADDIKQFYREVIQSPRQHLWVYSKKPSKIVEQKSLTIPAEYYVYP